MTKLSLGAAILFVGLASPAVSQNVVDCSNPANAGFDECLNLPNEAAGAPQTLLPAAAAAVGGVAVLAIALGGGDDGSSTTTTSTTTSTTN